MATKQVLQYKRRNRPDQTVTSCSVRTDQIEIIRRNGLNFSALVRDALDAYFAKLGLNKKIGGD